nr:hypothetical protein [uncultured bacterium]
MIRGLCKGDKLRPSAPLTPLLVGLIRKAFTQSVFAILI